MDDNADMEDMSVEASDDSMLFGEGDGGEGLTAEVDEEEI